MCLLMYGYQEPMRTNAEVSFPFICLMKMLELYSSISFIMRNAISTDICPDGILLINLSLSQKFSAQVHQDSE